MFSFQKNAVRVFLGILIYILALMAIPYRTWLLSKTNDTYGNADSRTPSGTTATHTSGNWSRTSVLEALLERYGYVINKPDLCKSSSNISVLIIVMSAPENLEQRQAIRETWGNASKQRGFKVAFLLGRPSNSSDHQSKILNEDSVHGDVIQANFSDTYLNLTLKSVIMIHWTRTFCFKAAFLLKIDDDVMLSVWDLTVALKTFHNTSRAIWGYLHATAAPHRNRRSKWYVSKEVYPFERYPVFVAGPSYLMSGDSVPLLDQAASKLPYFFLEDVFLTGIVAEKAGVRRISEPGFQYYRKYSRPCSLPRTITSHGHNPEDLKRSWSSMSSTVNEKECDAAILALSVTRTPESTNRSEAKPF